MKMLKKTAALTLTMGLLLASVPYAVLAEAPVTAAAGTLTQDQALAKVKELVPLPDGYELRNASYQEGAHNTQYGVPIWMLSFSDDERLSTGWVNVTIDATTGKLYSYSYNMRNELPGEHSISFDAAETKAMEYLKKFAPDKMTEMKEVDKDKAGTTKYGPYGPDSSGYSFRFVRTVNKVPFPYNGVTAHIDGNGVLREFHVTWSDSVQFPDATPKVTNDQAVDLFGKSLSLQLQYQRSYKPYMTQKSEFGLSYAPGLQTRMPVIDALQGVAIGTDGQPLKDPAPADLKPLTEQPGAPLSTTEIPKEDCAKMIAAYGVNLDGYTLESTSYQTDSYSNSKIWRIDYRKGDTNATQSFITFSIDAKTGELRDMFHNTIYHGPADSQPTPKLTRAEAQAKAIEFLKKAAPTQTDKIAIDPNSESTEKFGGGSYNFRFLPLVNGVPVNMTMFVNVDPTTGNVMDMHSQGPARDANGVYPDKSGAISQDAAKAKYLDKYRPTLQYVPVFDSTNAPYGPSVLKGAVLAFAPLNEAGEVLNAINGEWQTAWGGMPAGPVKVSDIKSHWAEKQLQAFADRGIFTVENGKLSPDQAVSRSDMLKYLVLAFGNSSNKDTKSSAFQDVAQTDPNYDFVQEAASRKWVSRDLKNFRPKDAITRQEFSEILVNILGYQKLAQAPNTFQDNFADVSPDDKPFYGDIAIVNSLGLLTTNYGYFYPTQSVSKAQTAVIITRLLDHVKDRPGFMY